MAVYTGQAVHALSGQLVEPVTDLRRVARVAQAVGERGQQAEPAVGGLQQDCAAIRARQMGICFRVSSSMGPVPAIAQGISPALGPAAAPLDAQMSLIRPCGGWRWSLSTWCGQSNARARGQPASSGHPAYPWPHSRLQTSGGRGSWEKVVEEKAVAGWPGGGLRSRAHETKSLIYPLPNGWVPRTAAVKASARARCACRRGCDGASRCGLPARGPRLRRGLCDCRRGRRHRSIPSRRWTP